MNEVLPDVSCAVHILGRKSVCVDRVFRPLREIVFHVTEIYIGSLRDNIIGFEKGIQQLSSVFRNYFCICRILQRMTLMKQLLLLKERLILIHPAVGAFEYFLELAVVIRLIFSHA